ncbi:MULTISPECIES: EamA/RhaT family transporter [unclassified Mucilaginibacter]|uniref:EamA/RhaT family transporter n=1 Tax=unclassified Mucilaginibacter TaxID=2617802 RepID=UPI002AC8E7DE|nr:MULTISPECIES: EamA/RhaT family transporter [unclassified Mucilaginibacter]MEB0260828.1 EamA/RhaT family transporter [Mucilaginibacter sp. 10I4]MEB0279043.1 EamA/RhaT family transporter [Mucilaginibacter sp. 10B2]MEB0299938.1 EamA/RhaT family transporter [Mucilaginibacter sp. 5C4]WPX22221.1 EamA/RhaT family transporter [Mucilaginibacter sp. 5C4]
MLYVFLSICCSVIVSVMLKLAKRYQIDVFQAITWNYSMAILLTWFFFKPSVPNLQSAPISIYLAVGFLLPVIFMVMAVSVRVAGIVRTDVAQRLSLFIPLLASFLLFGDKLNTLKVVGLIIGFIAILCSIPWQKKTANRKVVSNAWMYLLIVFFGIGIIDILFKQVAAFTAVPYTSSLFVIYILSFVIALIILGIRIFTKQTKFSWPHIGFGWLLGVANFGNILFYLKAHKELSGTPSTVFSAMNIGVIALGTLVGLVVFNERLSVLNKIGVALAVVAIVVITLSNN